MARSSRHPREVRERAVTLVLETQADYGSQWEAIVSVAEKVGVSVAIDAQPGVSFAWAVGDPQFASATWRYQLASDGLGGTILHYRAVMGPGPSGLSDEIAKARSARL